MNPGTLVDARRADENLRQRAAAPVETAFAYATDVADGDDDDTLPDYVFRTWYDYDTTTHVLTPADRTYVVRTTAGTFVKLRMTAYYDGVGTSGSPSFRWVALP